jgi:CubicO group peptidase (beta-lactamase class C family)
MTDKLPDVTPGDSPTPLKTYVKGAVVDTDQWTSDAPATKYVYGSINLAIAGLVVETITGMNLQAYAKSHLFDPLGMTEASFFLKDLDLTHIAQTYDGTKLTPKGLYGYPDYPSGQLRTSAPQLAKFLTLFGQKGRFQDKQIYSTDTYNALVASQIPKIDGTQGLVFYQATRGGKAVIGMDGLDRGVCTEMFIEPATQRGYVLLLNSNETSAQFPAALDHMRTKLMQLAATLP